MERLRLDATLFDNGDPHRSEYSAEHFHIRSWLSGFSGSFGMLVVTASSAGLWTDSRYYIEAEEALQDSDIALFRQEMPQVPDMLDWLCSELASGARVGCDGERFSDQQIGAFRRRLQGASIELQICDGLASRLYSEAPPLPAAPAFLLDVGEIGQSRHHKVRELRSAMRRLRADWHLISALDDIAWLLNLRGADVRYNPVALCWLLLNADGARLFIDGAKLSTRDREALAEDGVACRPYEDIYSALKAIPDEATVWFDPERTPFLAAETIRLRSGEGESGIIGSMSHTTQSKMVKHRIELAALRDCMVNDGVALVRCLCRLEVEMRGASPSVTELDVAAMLRSERGRHPLFVGESFQSIVGYGPHGAIVHYAATERGASKLHPDGLLLIDSGAHYHNGTTDITRTIALGPPTEAMRRDYTMVLKAHITLASVRFPAGSTGRQLDAIARIPLWRQGLDYGHGSGHGIGFFLCVHEWPANFSRSLPPQRLEVGMVLSNEPGLYRAGRYGIRLENVVAVQEWQESEFGRFYQLETLTLCHFERSLIEPTLLSTEERNWVDAYHRRVQERLAPALSPTESRWLANKTAPL